MQQALWWYLAVSLIGWLSFPLISRFFPNLPSRGYAVSRSLGLLLWGNLFWLLSSVFGLKNTHLLQGVVLGIYLGVSLWFSRHHLQELGSWFSAQRRFVVAVELLFLAGFVSFTFFRAHSPEIVGTEKPMELAFLNAILRSEVMPPRDPWLSGFSIAYYYLGYLLVALLSSLTSTPSGAAFNLAQGIWFSLAACGAYGILADLLMVRDVGENPRPGGEIPRCILAAALLAPVLLLLMGNAYGFMEMIHSRGLFWQEGSGLVMVSPFWQSLDLRGLDAPPAFQTGWRPDDSGGIPWWNASRVIRDVDFASQPVEVIDEFPNFSFILGDLHPHVLAIPFVLAVLALALEAHLRPYGGPYPFLGWELPFDPGGFLMASTLIGALALINIWDWPIYAGLYSAVMTLRLIRLRGWSWGRGGAFLLFGLGMALVGVLVYFPYFSSFSSQASGILPSLVFFTRGTHFWIHFGPLLVPLLGYLLWVTSSMRMGPRNWRKAVWILGLVMLSLVLFNGMAAWIASRLPDLGPLFMANLGAEGMPIGVLLKEALLRRLTSPGTLLTLGPLLVLGLGLFLSASGHGDHPGVPPVRIFVVLLITWGGILAFLPEFVYLLDFFGKRMNTIFKFYFQTWLLWSLAGGFGLCQIWRQARTEGFTLPALVLGLTAFLFGVFVVGTALFPEALTGRTTVRLPAFGAYILDWVFLLLGLVVVVGAGILLVRGRWAGLICLGAVVFLGVGSVYPLRAVLSRADFFRNTHAVSLDGTAVYRQNEPDLMAAVDWLWKADEGVVAEAVHPDGGSYTGYARISTLTGLPTVLGWRFHEVQWRGGQAEIGSRAEDMALLYETESWEQARGVIDKYNIEYILVAELERATYSVWERKFQRHLDLVFQQGAVCIYQTDLD
jgi:YYY domain-containing protein